jgi:glycosyltransferase involved in cell wall biosynthesis
MTEQEAASAAAPAARLVAVLIPCHNEALTIAKVIADFRAALPSARIHVFDNNSSDETYAIAVRAGASAHRVSLQGKGNVVRRMFADVDADVFVLVDGDDTYDAASAPKLVGLLVADSLDMALGVRAPAAAAAYRAGHAVGNRLLTGFLSWLFGRNCTDILSGYRAFSRRFVKSFPISSSGFEIETELTVHALEMSMQVGEVVTPYQERPEGSTSKLKTYSDGMRILLTILRLFSMERPFAFYGTISAVLAITSVVLAIPVAQTYLQTGLVPRFPTAILSTGLMLLSGLSFFAGLILSTVTKGRRETKMLAYLQLTPIEAERTALTRSTAQ